MSNTLWLDSWLIRTALAGGAVLLLGLLWMFFTRQPAQRQRIGEFSLCSGLLVAVLAALPGWWSYRVDWLPGQTRVLGDASASVHAANHGRERFIWDDDEQPALDDGYEGFWATLSGNQFERHGIDEWWLWMQPEEHVELPLHESEAALQMRSNPTPVGHDGEGGDKATEAESASLVSVFEPFPWPQLLSWAYFLVMGTLLIRCLAGYVGLWRLARTARTAPDHAQALLAKLTQGWQHKPRLGMLDRLHGPISFGLWRPTILLPPKFCHAGDQAALRALLVHELTHLQRRDAWSCLLLAVSQAVYFYLPWFWWLRRQIHLAQEYIADAAAAYWSSAVDYAQYLVSWSSWTTRPTLAGSRANGVFQRTSELYRRVDMLLKNPGKVEAACSRRWTFVAAASFLAVAALAAGVRVQAEEKDDPKDVILLLDNEDDARIEKKTETRRFMVREKKEGETKTAQGQRIQIVIVGEDGETKLAELPAGVQKLLLQPAKEDGKPQRVELMLIEEKGATTKEEKKPVILSTRGHAVTGNVKAHAVWQGSKPAASKSEGPNVMRIVAVDGDKTKKVEQHQIQIIGVDGKDGKHNVRFHVKPIVGVAPKGEQVDVIIVDGKGDVFKKQVKGDVLWMQKPGSEPKAPQTMFFRLVDGKEGQKPFELRLDGESGLRGVWVDGMKGRAMPPMPPVPPMAPMAPMARAFQFTPHAPHTNWHVVPGAMGAFMLQHDDKAMKEQLDKVTKALEELQRALDKAGDRIPTEARKQLIEAKRQLEAARTKLTQGRIRTSENPLRIQGRVQLDKDAEKLKEKKESLEHQHKELHEHNARLEHLKQMARVARQQAEAQRQQAENMARLAKEREAQARDMAAAAEAQARKAEAELNKLREEAEKSVGQARREAMDQANRARMEADRAAVLARQRALELAAKNEQIQKLRELAEARKKAEEKAKDKADKEKADTEKAKDSDSDTARRRAIEGAMKARLEQEREAARKLTEANRAKVLRDQDAVRRFAEANRAADLYRNSRLGVQVEPVNVDLAAQLDLPAGKFVVVRQVIPGSAAEKAGFKQHDILLTYAGKEVGSKPEDLVNLVNESRSNRGLEAVVLRKGKKVVLRNIDLGARRDSEPKAKADEGRKESSSSSFTIISDQDDVRITIKGKVADGQMKPDSITIKDDNNEDTYDSLRRVPSKYRSKVQKLLEQSGKSSQ